MITRKAKHKKDLSNVANAMNKRIKTIKSLPSQSDKTLSEEENPNKNNSDLKMQPKSGTNEKKHPLAAKSKSAYKKFNKAKLIIKKKENSKNKTQKILCRNDRNKITKNKGPRFKKISLSAKFAMATESVKKRCEILAQKTKELIKNNKRNPETSTNENCQYICSNFISSKKKIAIQTKVNEIVTHECFPLPPKFEHEVGKNKQFKSNYDLLQTIINSQQIINKHKQFISVEDCSMPKEKEEREEKTSKHLKQRVLTERIHVPLVRELNNQAPYQNETPDYNSRLLIRDRETGRGKRPVKSLYTNILEVSQTNDHHNPFQSNTPDNNNIRPFVSEPDDVVSCLAATTNSNIRPYLMRVSNNTSPFQFVTFQSHNYVESQDFETESNVDLYNFYRQPRNFITTQSRENFIDFPKTNMLKTNKINLYAKLLQTNNLKREINKSMKMFNMENNTVKGIRESYTIEFTESNEYESILNYRKDTCSLPSTNQNNTGSIEAITSSMSCLINDSRHQYVPPKESKPWLITINNRENGSDKDYEPSNKNTFTITNSYKDKHLYLSCNKDVNIDKTYTIDSTNKCGYQYSHLEKRENHDIHDNSITVSSNSPENDFERQITNPIDVCETILEEQEMSTDGIREFDSSFHCIRDSCNNLNVNIGANDIGDLPDKISNVFNNENPCNEKHLTKTRNLEELKYKHIPTLTTHHSKKTTSNELDYNEQYENVVISKITNENNDTGAFKIKNRMVFVPKGK